MTERSCGNCRWQGLWRCPLPRDGAVFDWQLNSCDRWELLPPEDTGPVSRQRPFPNAVIFPVVFELGVADLKEKGETLTDHNNYSGTDEEAVE